MEKELEKSFLAELEALDKFRISYTGLYPSVPLVREDPDVRRLLEALAFFTARTRLAGERNVNESLFRIFRQHYPYLLMPVPALVMLKAVPTRRYVDVSSIPKGTDFALIRPGTLESPERTFFCKSLVDMQILPIEIQGLDTLRTPSRGYRIVLRMAAAYERHERIDELPLYIDYLNDLHSSLLVTHELKTHLREATVVWSHRVNETTVGDPCTVRIGPRSSGGPSEGDVFEHPVERARAAFHAPQPSLYVNVTNLRAPKKWQEFSLVLDLAETWPANLRLNSECFQLHVVPAVNATRQTARPIEFDGTMDRLLAQHPDRVSKFVPLAVQAVYKTTDEGLAPLELASVASGVESYEAVVEGRELERRAWIFPKLPNAFDEPESLVVDATWHQPDFSATRADELVPRLSGRFVEGVTWSSQGPLVPYVDSDLDQDRSTLLELLSFKSQRVFGVEEIRTLLRSLGVHRERMFSKFLSKLSAARVVDKPNSKHASGLRHVYILSFDDLTPSDVPRLDLFCSRLLEVLSAFSADEVVELVAHVPNLEKELRYV